MNNWFTKAWAGITAWLAQTANKAKAAGLAILAAMAALFVIAASADDAALSWTNATQWTDGSALTIDDLAQTELWRQSFALDADIETEPRNYEPIATVEPIVTSYNDADLPNGIHCYVAYHVATNGQRSDASAEACKIVDKRRPGAPAGLDVT